MSTPTTVRHVHHADRCLATARDALAHAMLTFDATAREAPLRAMVSQALADIDRNRDRLSMVIVTIDATTDRETHRPHE